MPARALQVFVAGWLAGLTVGAADALHAWPRLQQFLASPGHRVLFALYTGALYAIAIAPLALVASGALVVLRRYSSVAATVLRWPASALSVAVWAACLNVALIACHRAGLDLLSAHHTGLISLSMIALTLCVFGGACLIASALSTVFATLVERVMPPRVWRVLHDRRVAAACVIAVVGAAAAVFYRNWEQTLDKLDLRPLVVALLLAASVPIAAIPVRRFAYRAWDLWRWRALACAPIVLVGGSFAAVAAGSANPAYRSASSATGLVGIALSALQRIGDRDGDGYAGWFGGGDCDDADAGVHPGAIDIPDDGVDQSCLGGDLTLEPERTPLRRSGLPARPNILLITVDTLASGHTSAYGYERSTTPALARLASEGTLFADAWATSSWTRFSIPAILTGLYPSQIQWRWQRREPGVAPANEPIGVTLQRAGYHTAAILNHRYFDEARGLAVGFDVYDNTNRKLHKGFAHGTSAKEQADRALAFLAEPHERPFFLWVHFYDPHGAYMKHEEPCFGDADVDRYDCEIQYTDRHLGRVLRALEQRGLAENTAVIVTSDHGETFGNHGLRYHGKHLYADLLRVPLVLAIPGAPRGRVVGVPVSHVDIVPTIVDLLGLPHRGAGDSLLPFIHGDAAPADRTVYHEVSYSSGGTTRWGLATKRWHLIYNMRPSNTYELYARPDDPAEQRDLSHQLPPPLKNRLGRWIDRMIYARARHRGPTWWTPAAR